MVQYLCYGIYPYSSYPIVYTTFQYLIDQKLRTPYTRQNIVDLDEAINLKIIDDVVTGESKPILTDIEQKELEVISELDNEAYPYQSEGAMPEQDQYTE